MASALFPFRGWWAPASSVRRWWASVGVRLPVRVPVVVLARGSGGGGPRSWLVVGPRGRLAVVVSRSVVVAPSGWSASWRALGGPCWSVLRSLVCSSAPGVARQLGW